MVWHIEPWMAVPVVSVVIASSLYQPGFGLIGLFAV